MPKPSISPEELIEMANMMNILAGAIDRSINPTDKKVNGFALFVFPLADNTERRANFVSNVDRSDIIAVMKEILTRWVTQDIQTTNKEEIN